MNAVVDPSPTAPEIKAVETAYDGLIFVNRDAIKRMPAACLPDTPDDHKQYCRVMNRLYQPNDVALNIACSQQSSDRLVSRIRGATGLTTNVNGRDVRCLPEQNVTRREYSLHRAKELTIYGRPHSRKPPVPRKDIDAVFKTWTSKDWKDPAKVAMRRLIEDRIFAWRHYVIFRVDVDAHNGEIDADAQLQSIAAYFPMMYMEQSPRGCSGYILIELRALPWQALNPDYRIAAEVDDEQDRPLTWKEHFQNYGPYGCGAYLPSKPRICKLLSDLKDSLRAIRLSSGFQSGVDVQGDETEFEYDEDTGEIKGVKRRGTLMRLPRCPNPGDIDRLEGAVITYDQFTETCYRLGVKARQSAYAAPTPTATSSRSKRKKRSIATDHRTATSTSITQNADKHTVTLRFIREELREGGTNDQVVERALNAYEEAGHATGPRDRTRIRRFHRVLKYLKSHPKTQAGYDPDWFDDHDLHRAEMSLRGAISYVELAAKFNMKRGTLARVDQIYRDLALTLCAFGKNIHSGNLHEVPQTSIKGMLGSFNRKSDDNYVRKLTELLQELGYIQKLTTHRPGKCCTWQMSIKGLVNLPFLRTYADAVRTTTLIKLGLPATCDVHGDKAITREELDQYCLEQEDSLCIDSDIDRPLARQRPPDRPAAAA